MFRNNTYLVKIFKLKFFVDRITTGNQSPALVEHWLQNDFSIRFTQLHHLLKYVNDQNFNEKVADLNEVLRVAILFVKVSSDYDWASTSTSRLSVLSLIARIVRLILSNSLIFRFPAHLKFAPFSFGDHLQKRPIASLQARLSKTC